MCDFKTLKKVAPWLSWLQSITEKPEYEWYLSRSNFRKHV